MCKQKPNDVVHIHFSQLFFYDLQQKKRALNIMLPVPTNEFILNGRGGSLAFQLHETHNSQVYFSWQITICKMQ